jgi:hypothetical protein
LTTSPRFSSLCAAFLERLGGSPVASEEAEEGFEFESEGLRARVEPGSDAPDAGGEEDFLITVSMCTVDLEHGALLSERLLLLARLNHLSRQQHPWVTAVDESQQLSLIRRMPLEGASVESLEKAIVEGFARAQSLLQLWQTTIESAGGPAGADVSPVLGQPAILKA